MWYVLGKKANIRKSTDWTTYYEKDRGWFSMFTQGFTLNEILRYIRNISKGIDIIELGGGNSCFAKSICDSRTINSYDIIDNYELAVR